MVFGDDKQRDPKVYLLCFDRIRPIKDEVEDHVLTSARGRKNAVSVLPSWGDICRISDLLDLHKAPPVNEQFLHLLDKPLASSPHIAMSVDECARLETCIRGLVESQSFSSWAIA